ncbi:MAG: hypothetical protein NC337_16040, partial [Roseburia sp.]|nr:hypothetical protein [Roseburia sp.]
KISRRLFATSRSEMGIKMYIYYFILSVFIIVMTGISAFSFVRGLPHKREAASLLGFGGFLAVCIVGAAVPGGIGKVNIMGGIACVVIYLMYVTSYVYMKDIFDVEAIFVSSRAKNQNSLWDACLMSLSATCFIILLPILSVMFANRAGAFDGFGDYVFFCVAAVCMLIECLFMIVSVIKLNYNTVYEVSVFKLFFVLLTLIVSCICSFAILNTSLNSIDFSNGTVIAQEDCFVDCLYQYTCIFTLQYGSSETLPRPDKTLHSAALIYSYLFIAAIIGMVLNTFMERQNASTEKE